MAALIATRPGRRPRLIYRTRRERRGDRRKGFTETDYAQLLNAAHQQLHGPVVLVWDNLNTHVSRAMRELVAARDWLTVFQLPPYASELNPVEPVWSNLKRSLANLTKVSHRQARRRCARPGSGVDADRLGSLDGSGQDPDSTCILSCRRRRLVNDPSRQGYKRRFACDVATSAVTWRGT